MSTALARIDDKTLAVLDDVASHELVQATPDITKKFSTALQVAAQINRIRGALNPQVIKEIIRPLKDCGTLGFTTDEAQRNRPYTDDEIASCVTEALLRGGQLVGNEFTVFQGKCFFTKPYYERKVRTFPGITNLDVQCSTPRMSTGGALVECVARFNKDGKPQIIERTGTNAIAVRLQGNGGADMAIGKAEKRMYRFILNFVAGYAPPSEPEDAEDATSKVVHETTAEVGELVDDGPKGAEVVTLSSQQMQVPAQTFVAPVATGNEAAKAAIKTKTVKPKKEPAPTPLPEPTPEPVAEATPETQAQPEAPVEEPLVQNEPGELEEEPAAVSVAKRAVVKLQKLTVAAKDTTTNKATKIRLATDAGDFFVLDPESAKSIAHLAKSNSETVVLEFKEENGERIVMAWSK